MHLLAASEVYVQIIPDGELIGGFEDKNVFSGLNVGVCNSVTACACTCIDGNSMTIGVCFVFRRVGGIRQILLCAQNKERKRKEGRWRSELTEVVRGGEKY